MPKTATIATAPATPEREVGVNVSLPASLHRRLKVVAAEKGITLREAITAAVDQWTASA